MVPWFQDIQVFLRGPALLLILGVQRNHVHPADQVNQVDLEDQENLEIPCFLVVQHGPSLRVYPVHLLFQVIQEPQGLLVILCKMDQ